MQPILKIDLSTHKIGQYNVPSEWIKVILGHL
jgi:hypothetical protein